MNITGRKLQDPAHLQELLAAAIIERDFLVVAAKDALDLLKGLGEDMRTRAKELEGDNRKASDLLAYYAPDGNGRVAKALQAAIRRVQG